jgi:hypothetical protein
VRALKRQVLRLGNPLFAVRQGAFSHCEIVRVSDSPSRDPVDYCQGTKARP